MRPPRRTSSTSSRIRYLGRKSALKLALREVRDRETGMALNAARAAIEEAFAAARGRARRASAREDLEPFDVTLPGERPPRGRLHLITQIRREIEDIFLGLGYEVFDGPEVETVFNNFTRSTRPRRTRRAIPQDTFYVDDETVSAHAHVDRPDPLDAGAGSRRSTSSRSAAATGATRRDPTHTPTFHQVECLAVDRGISLADLRGTVEYFFRALFGQEREVRMRTSFFPFTEPSVEFDVTCFICGGAGLQRCASHSGWIEMGGAGDGRSGRLRGRRLRPRGVVRVRVRLRHRADRDAAPRLPDLRLFWNNDLRFLRQF